MQHALVAVPVPLGQAFTYSVPADLETRVRAGARVLCDFGKRRIVGVVVAMGEPPADVAPDKIRPIRAVVDEEPALPSELLQFLQELSHYYMAPIGEVMRLALPPIERSATAKPEEAALLADAGVMTVGRLTQFVQIVPRTEPLPELAPRAVKLLELVRSIGPVAITKLEESHPGARAQIKRLESLGLVSIERRIAESDPFFAAPAEPDAPPRLNAAQERAVSAIVERLTARTASSFLLHGVTASGKTEVYLRAVSQCLAQGRGAIILVPEIALTPQLVARFRARLGDAIAVLHSGLGGRERHSMWKSLRTGQLRVAIGARSALFAPVTELGLICVDEEHDPSFKQEEGVRYNARDMALLRAHRAAAVCVVGSATPSLSSEALVSSGKIRRLSLPDRARTSAALPAVEIVDLRRVGPGPGGERLLTVPLYRALERVLDAREQSILFLNRRGFSPSLVCEECGKVAECPNCSVALTLHRTRGERLVCHYCDYSTPQVRRCAECGSDRLSQEGAGTERIESALKAVFPEARIARMDRDVAAGLKSEKILERVRRREVDILVGTQMVTKGHDLPAVTLVGVLNADAALSMPDFNAAERTFQLLVQVAGRAGRSDAPGTVLIQTRNPDHPAIVMAARHDVAGFAEQELRDRRDLFYPPYSRIALVRIDALDERIARSEADRLARLARRASTKEVGIVGPAPAPILRLRNRYRFRFMVRAKERRDLRRALLAVAAAKVDRRVRFSIDVDPMNML